MLLQMALFHFLWLSNIPLGLPWWLMIKNLPAVQEIWV